MDDNQWLATIREEYLKDFVREGGAAVKFAISRSPNLRARAAAELAEAATRANYECVFVDASATKIHLVDALFHEVAHQIDWEDLTYRFLVSVLTDDGWIVPDRPEDLKLPTLARLNDREEAMVRSAVSRLVENRILRDYEMCREFRLAMVWFCDSQLNPNDNPALKVALTEWLRGELRRVATLRRALIFQKIARHNARHMLFSLAHWLKIVGKNGLVLVLDIDRYTENVPKAERQSGLYYGTSAALDLYEVLRQFIDATDEMEYCFVAVLAGPDFLTDPNRGLPNYQALRLRIWDEVRDRNLPNPLSSLARLDGTTAGLAPAVAGAI